MSQAAFGLAGVVIGGLLTGFVSFVLERRRERQQGRVGRRVARSELKEAGKVVTDALAWRNWPAGWDMNWSDSWSAYRPALAATLSDDAFATLAQAYLNMHLLQVGLRAGTRPLIQTDDEFLTSVNSSITKAIELLDRDG